LVSQNILRSGLSPKGSITVNRLMRSPPEHLVKNIVYHEVTHFLVKKHGKRFRSIMGRRFDVPKGLEEELFGFWFVIQREHSNT